MTRAVLLSRFGAVHRVIGDSNGNDITGCGHRCVGEVVPVTSLQALVYHLPECSGGLCWRLGAWQHFLEGVTH